jgi:hypothetical protein
MHTFVPLTVLLVVVSAFGSEKYKPSSRTTHHTKRNNRLIREDSREVVVQDDIPKKVSPRRKVHPPAQIPPFQRNPTLIPGLRPPPMYRQESTVGLSGEDWRSVNYPVVLHGGGGGASFPQEAPQGLPLEAQNIDINVRGMQRLEGRRGRECCDRPEGQRWPNWITCFFACCAGRR